MKIIKKVTVIIGMSFLLTSCVGGNLLEDNSNKQESNNEDKNNPKTDDTVQNSTETQITKYITEPKATYDPNNKIGVPEVYGVTEAQRNYESEIDSKEREATKREIKATEKDNGREPMKKENMYNIGDKLLIDKYKCTLIINSVDVLDNIKNASKEGFFDKDNYSNACDCNTGKLNKVLKSEFLLGKETEEREEINIKFVTIDCTLEGNSEWVAEIPLGNISLIPFVKDGDYYEKYNVYEGRKGNGCLKQNYYAISDNELIYYVYGDFGEPVFFDKAIFTKPAYRSDFFFTYISKGEKINFRLGYYVDEELLKNMCVFYSEYGDSVYTDSVLQRGVKLF